MVPSKSGHFELIEEGTTIAYRCYHCSFQTKGICKKNRKTVLNQVQSHVRRSHQGAPPPPILNKPKPLPKKRKVSSRASEEEKVDKSLETTTHNQSNKNLEDAWKRFSTQFQEKQDVTDKRWQELCDKQAAFGMDQATLKQEQQQLKKDHEQLKKAHENEQEQEKEYSKERAGLQAEHRVLKSILARFIATSPSINADAREEMERKWQEINDEQKKLMKSMTELESNRECGVSEKTQKLRAEVEALKTTINQLEDKQKKSDTELAYQRAQSAAEHQRMQQFMRAKTEEITKLQHQVLQMRGSLFMRRSAIDTFSKEKAIVPFRSTVTIEAIN